MATEDYPRRSDDDNRANNIAKESIKTFREYRKLVREEIFWSTWKLAIVAVVAFTLGYNLTLK
jgi:hypothetical protein